MKVQPFQILKPLNENLLVQVDKSKTFYNQLHQHNEIQLSLILKGNGKLIIGDSIHQFKDGDFFALGANSPHVFKSDNTIAQVHMISLFFTDKTFGDDFFQLSDLEETRAFFDSVKDGFQVLSGIEAIHQLMLQLPHDTKLSKLIAFFTLLKLLIATDKKPLTSFVYPKETGTVAGERMQIIFDYVLHNFQKEIKLHTIAGLIYMTPNAFCKFFKQRTNKTFFQFLIELRIEHSCQLLQRKRDLAIAEISEASGFKSISNFNRKFKLLKGIIPSQYRKKRLQNDVIGDNTLK